MKYEDVEGGHDFKEIHACPYCEHYKSDGHDYLCFSEETPYNTLEGMKRDYPFLLSSLEEFFGCEQIKHNGRKMKPSVYKTIPKDGNLRLIPVQDIVEDYSGQLDIEPRFTIADLIEAQNKIGAHGAGILMLKTLSIPPLRDSIHYPSTLFVDGQLVVYDPVDKKIIGVFFEDKPQSE